VRGSMEHLREIRPRCHGGDGLQPTGARRWKLLELVAEQFAATRPFFFFFDLRGVSGPAYAHHDYSPRPTGHPASPGAGKAPRE